MTSITFRSPFSMIRCLGCGTFIALGSKLVNVTKEALSMTHIGVESYRLHAKCTRCKTAIIFTVDEDGHQIVIGASEVERQLSAEEESANEVFGRLVERMNEEEMRRYTNNSPTGETTSEKVFRNDDEALVAGDATMGFRFVKFRQDSLNALVEEIFKQAPLSDEVKASSNAEVFEAERRQVGGMICPVDDSGEEVNRSKDKKEVISCSPQPRKRIKMDLSTYIKFKKQKV